MRGFVLCGILTLLGGVKPWVEGVPMAGTQRSDEATTVAVSQRVVRDGPLARQGPGTVPSSPRLGPDVECTGIVVDTDPRVDVGMAQPAADNPDAAMVVRSPCRKQNGAR